ncbi:MAG TPA: hypothetical protein VGA78_16120, partial [Gemmatimonadales bacterium]
MTAPAAPGLPARFEERLPHLLARLTALLIAWLGLTVLVGWAAGWDSLVRLGAGFPALSPNAALTLLGAAAALGAVDHGSRRIARFAATVVIVISSLTFLQYLLNLDFGIDRLLLPTDAELPGVRYPGRMAAGSALCLMFSGTALLALSVNRHTDAIDITAGVLGVTVASVGGIVLLGYLTGVLQELRHSVVAGMSLYGALGLLLLGSSIVAIAWRRDMALATLPRWSAAAIAMAGVTATALFWKALVQRDEERLDERLGYEAAVARQSVAAQIDALIKDLGRLGRRTGQLSLAAWTDDATAAVRDIDLYEAVAWIDRDDQLRAVVPWTAAAWVDRLRQGERSGAVDTVRMHGYPTDPVSAELVESETLLAVRVAACGDSTCTGKLAGFINLERLFTRAIGTSDRDLCLTVSTGGRTLFARDETSCRRGTRRGYAYLAVGPLSWTLTVAPTPLLLSATSSPLPIVLLCLGVVVSGLMATSLRLAQTSWQLAREAE